MTVRTVPTVSLLSGLMENLEKVKLNIEAAEAARYLGYKGSSPDAVTLGLINKCAADVSACLELRSVRKRLPVTRGSSGDGICQAALSIGTVRTESRDLAKNLSGCDEAFLFGATIGIGLDRLIKRETSRDMAKAAIYQAVGAAYIESYCDHINSEIKQAAAAEGLLTRPRFSPGFGDFTLDHQNMIFRELDMTKKTGASLTDGMLMIPSKTVTAVVGLYWPK